MRRGTASQKAYKGLPALKNYVLSDFRSKNDAVDASCAVGAYRSVIAVSALSHSERRFPAPSSKTGAWSLPGSLSSQALDLSTIKYCVDW